MAVMRVEDAAKYNSLDSLLNAPAILGVVDGTTGHIFVKRNFPKAKKIVVLSKASDSVFELKKRRGIDIFVHDAPSIIWLISENEADLEGFGKLLNKECLAWGVGLDDKEFLVRVNAILSQWKKNGTLNKILDNWLPYLKKLDN
jgi:ABC-type amino acid transport substrate-binding protein